MPENDDADAGADAGYCSTIKRGRDVPHAAPKKL